MSIPALVDTVETLAATIDRHRRRLQRSLHVSILRELPAGDDWIRAALDVGEDVKSVLANAADELRAPVDLSVDAKPGILIAFLASARHFRDELEKLGEETGLLAELECLAAAAEDASARATDLREQIRRCRDLQSQVLQRLTDAWRSVCDKTAEPITLDALVEGSLRKYPVINSYLAR